MGGSLDLDTVLLLALLPAIGNLLGVALAEWRKPPAWLTGASLHMAAGLATGVAAIELVPRSLARGETCIVAVAIIVGALFSVLLVSLSRRLRGGSSGGDQLLWGAYTAVVIDLFTDGLMTGGGSAVTASLGMLLAASQVLGNLPGGFAITAGFREAGVPRRTRLMAVLSFPLAPIAGGVAGFLLLDGASDATTGFVLALFAGLLLTATIEDLIPEADAPGTSRKLSSPAFAGGFVLLLLMSSYLGN
ncbi:ZIP family metal transporter [Aurantiacibacter zhengii]|uniref:ZIP family zinc transporter n=1 Tax=Aurantiacibacter zhengii TaxID=2307003 RepID=A0A418NQ62_9SPHN|nr:hypothetical protein [Aurantiacibacter zhengii]RIV84622.1 hypothetical protein D2V07_13650 [Aurantiacibacter zhengii]